MDNGRIEFCDLSTHFFVSDGIQVTLRYPATNNWPLALSDGLRVLLCSESEHERVVKATTTLSEQTRQGDGDWVQATLVIPASELEGLNSGEYWLRCERHREGGAVVAVGRCAPFSICLEPRDIPLLKTSNELYPAEREHRSPSSLSGSFVLVEGEEEEGEGEEDECEDVDCHTTVEPIEGARSVRPSPREERRYPQEGRLHHERDLAPFNHSSSATTGIEPSVVTCGTQTDVALSAVTVAEPSPQKAVPVSIADPNVVQLANMSASTTCVTTLSDAEISVLKSNNRDLLVKVKKLTEKNSVLEREKEAEARARREIHEQLVARLAEVEGQSQLLRAQLSQSEAARAALVSERDDAVTEKVSLATERDGLCAELLRLGDECAAHVGSRDALHVQLQSKVAELQRAKEKVNELERTMGVLNDELKGVFERCTQMEGKLISKENELRMTNEKLAECKKELNRALAARRNAAAKVGGNGEGSHDRGEMTSEREKPTEKRERSADRSDDVKRSSTRDTTRPALDAKRSVKPHLPDTTRPTDANILLPPPLLPLPPRVRDEFVTGVDNLKARKHHHRQHPHSSPSRLPQDPRGTDQFALIPAGPQILGPTHAAPPITTGDPQKSASVRSEGEVEVFWCPVCQMDLHSRDTVYAATLHVEHCLLKQGERQGGGATEDAPKKIPDPLSGLKL